MLPIDKNQIMQQLQQSIDNVNKNFKQKGIPAEVSLEGENIVFEMHKIDELITEQFRKQNIDVNLEVTNDIITIQIPIQNVIEGMLKKQGVSVPINSIEIEPEGEHYTLKAYIKIL